MEATKRCPFCAEEILSAAVKCKHCGSSLHQSELQSPISSSTTTPKADLGWAILALPVAGMMAMWLWVGSMSLLQGPMAALELVVVTVIVGTAVLCATEASKLGMRSDRKAGTYSPTAWAALVLLMWIIGYPAYLFKRRRYGLPNLLALGILIAILFLGSILAVNAFIESQVQHLQESLTRPG